MNITTNSVIGMNSAEKEIFFSAMGRNHKYEADKVEQMKEETKSYRDMMIEDILVFTDVFTREDLTKKSTRTLERIYDNC